MSSKRSCVIVEPPPLSGNGNGGTKDIEVLNYRIEPVEADDKNWVDFAWDENDVGKHMKSGEELVLYVSLGNKSYLNSQQNKGLSAEELTEFKEKYLAYIAFHLWLLYEKSIDKSEEQKLNEQLEKLELQRIVQTVLLAMNENPRFR